MFEVKNNSIKIDGTKGKYDNSVSNTSTRYGRNAVDNFYSYMEKPLIEDAMNPAPILDFGISKDAVENNIKQLDNFTKTNDAYLNSLPPLEFEYRYMPQLPKGEIDKEALIGAAYEEMGKREKVSVAEMDNTIAPTDNYTSKSLDINKDGYITNSEYASSILGLLIFTLSFIKFFSSLSIYISKFSFQFL